MRDSRPQGVKVKTQNSKFRTQKLIVGNEKII